MRFHPYAIVDVFTDTPLEGNALAVFLGAAGLDTDLMQRTARELNLSETVFVLTEENQSSAAEVPIRIFTPASELPFAGHPILGTAFVLGERLDTDSIRLIPPAGPVPVTLRREAGRIAYGEMEQPMPVIEGLPHADDVLSALDIPGSELPIEAYRNGPVHAYITLGSESAVAGLRPDMRALQALSEPVCVNCVAGTGVSYKTRMFAPALGVAEDPATGSAAGPLALHLVRHGRLAYGEEISIRQGVEIGRPSLLRARVEGADGRVERIVVGGAAVIVAHGEYRLR